MQHSSSKLKIKGKDVSDFTDSLDTENMTFAEYEKLLDEKFPNLVKTDWTKPISETNPAG
jgi:hypothetical protein